MQNLKTCLVLIIAILLNGACNPYTPAMQANSTPPASTGVKVQSYPATPTLTTIPSQLGGSTSTVQSVAPSESKVDHVTVSTPDTNFESSIALAQNTQEDPGLEEEEVNPETAFPLAPDTQWDPGNGGSGEVESSGAFSLHSQAAIEMVDQFYQSALANLGWKLRYIDANSKGGLTQNWKMDMLYMSVEFSYDQTGLAIQAHWHQVDLKEVRMLPMIIPIPDQAEFVDATDSTWQIYIRQGMKAVTEYYQQKATALNWEPGSLPEKIEVKCSGDCLNQAVLTYPPRVTPMPTVTPDPRPEQTLAYTMTDGNEISLEFLPHQDSTILNISLTLKNVESAGLPEELQIYPGATGMVIAPGLVRFTVPVDVKTTVQFYIDVLTNNGWKPYAGYSLDTPQLYFQEWDKGEESLRLNISSSGSSSQSSMVSIQCLECTAP